MLHNINCFTKRIMVKIKFLRTKFDIVIRDRMPHIKISEKYEKKIKWILRILIIIGIISSIFAFPEWYYSLLFSIICYLIEQVFEKIIYSQNVMLVQPLPQSWDGSKLTGMIFGYDNKGTFLGFGFSDIKVGKDFWNTLFAWNEDEKRVHDKVQLSLIEEDKKNYSVYVYPTLQRDFIDRNYKKLQIKYDKRENFGKELDVHVVQFIMCKVFPISPSCAYRHLENKNSNIRVMLFDTSRVFENNPNTYLDVSVMEETEMIFDKVLVCKRKKLVPKENVIEYYHIPKY